MACTNLLFIQTILSASDRIRSWLTQFRTSRKSRAHTADREFHTLTRAITLPQRSLFQVGNIRYNRRKINTLVLVKYLPKPESKGSAPDLSSPVKSKDLLFSSATTDPSTSLGMTDSEIVLKSNTNFHRLENKPEKDSNEWKRDFDHDPTRQISRPDPITSESSGKRLSGFQWIQSGRPSGHHVLHQ